MNKTSDYLEYDVALNKGLKLLNDKKMCVFGFYIIFSINTGLRVSDIMQIKHSDLSGDKIYLKEKKTKKAREISLNNVVRNSYQSMLATLDLKNANIDNNYVFLSQKGTVYRTQSINVILKTLFNTKRLQISSHSLRKAFARKVYENMNESENALVLLSDIFNHSNIAITRRYLGIRQETIDNIYLTLE
jgi:site-specific recombinase XerD